MTCSFARPNSRALAGLTWPPRISQPELHAVADPQDRHAQIEDGSDRIWGRWARRRCSGRRERMMPLGLSCLSSSTEMSGRTSSL